MALKDWKNIKFGVWKKIRNKRYSSFPTLKIIVPWAFSRRQVFEVILTTTDGRTIQKFKSFKTMTLAYNFAKSYMRTH